MRAPEAIRSVRHLIVGAGVSGLGFANAVRDQDYLILERDDAIGGYCKTVRREGFVWDYSGHFLHLRDAGMRQFFAERMDTAALFPVRKATQIYFGGRLIDYPFQRNVHQLPAGHYARCVASLLAAPRRKQPQNLEEMLEGQAGREIVRLFLRPYNEKLHQCALGELAPFALGRFFPAMTARQALLNGIRRDNRSYNDTFLHPRNGIFQYVEALARDLDPARIRLGEALTGIDLARREATTSSGARIRFTNLVTSAPLPSTLRACGEAVPAGLFTHSKVLVLNLGFDRPGTMRNHWVYFPDPALEFYRVGSYDYLFGTDRMSLYVECAIRPDDDVDVAAVQARVLAQLRAVGIVRDHRLVASHHVVMDPAYVHIRTDTEQWKTGAMARLKAGGVHPVGRYGTWTYCSIEDNLLEVNALAKAL